MLANLGRVRLLRDDAGAARGLFADGLRLARDRNDRRVAAELVQGLAAVLARRRRVGRGGAAASARPTRCARRPARRRRRRRC